jgi:hypothetical protein
MARRNLLLVSGLLLILACGGETAGETTPPASVADGGAAPSDSGRPSDAASDTAPAPDASLQLVACEGCLALHCATYGTCERDPQCIQALAAYIDCTRRNAESACSRDLENNASVPGDITLCLAASCTTDCSSH